MKTQHVIERTAHRQKPKVEAARKTLLDNDQVTVIETDYPVGGSVPMHEHRFPHVTYAVEGGRAETTAPDGTVKAVSLRSGQAMWREAQSHSTRNVGTTPLRIVEVEIKNGPGGIAGERKPRTAIPAELKWTTDPMDPRRKTALLVGDPTKPGPYVVRLRVPAGYSLGLHVHPTEDEYLMVMSGSLHWATAEAAGDASEHLLPAGGLLVSPAGTPHRVWTTEETELQMSGIGPRTYRFLKLSDNPLAKS